MNSHRVLIVEHLLNVSILPVALQTSSNLAVKINAYH